jgi:hypothetical protein
VARKQKITGMNLSPIWFIEKPIDFEHKQYVLLAYLQKVEKGFKANNLADFLYETRYHSKNIECFLTIRSLLELRDVPGPTDEQREYFKTVAAKPDDNPDLMEAIKISKWSIKKLQDTIKTGSEVFKKIESNLKMYCIGKPMDKNTGYLLLRYAGSPVFECYKFIYDPTFKDVTFTLHQYYDMPTKSDFIDVKLKVLEEEYKANDLFVAVESDISYDTRKSVFPVLNHLFASKIYNKNILGLSI